MRAEFAGGEGVEGAETRGEFGVAQAALAVKPAEKVQRGAFSFLGIALQTAGDQVAVRIAAELGLGHDMVKAASLGRKLTQTIKTTATFPGLDGIPEGCGLQEVHALGVDGGGIAGRDTLTEPVGFIGACRADLVGQEHLKHVSGLATLEQAQDTARDEATYGPACGVLAETNTASKPLNGKPEVGFTLEAAMAEEVPINHAVSDREPQPRDEMIHNLLPDEFSVGFFVFHRLGPGKEVRNREKVTVPTGSESAIDSWQSVES